MRLRPANSLAHFAQWMLNHSFLHRPTSIDSLKWAETVSRFALPLVLAALLAACADPGSGGSGIPSVITSPSLPAPPVNLSALRVESLEPNAATIGGVRYIDTQIEVVLADGSAGSFGSLKVGQAVVVSEVVSSPVSAGAIARWKVAIQPAP
jgi:hypothetical protein